MAPLGSQRVYRKALLLQPESTLCSGLPAVGARYLGLELRLRGRGAHGAHAHDGRHEMREHHAQLKTPHGPLHLTPSAAMTAL